MAPVDVVNIRRVLIGFASNATAADDAIATAAELASLLGAELTGLFVEDELLFDAATLPWLRAIEPGRLIWQALNEAELAQSHALAARTLERLLLGKAAALGVAAAFEVVRGDPATALALRAEPTDLLVIAEPADPIARALHQSQVLNAIGQTSATVLYVPHGARRRGGPVVALARKASDPALKLGAPVARALNERLIVVAMETSAEQEIAVAARSSMDGECITLRLDASMALGWLDAVSRTLSAYRERLIVVDRGTRGEALPEYLRLASDRAVSLLLAPG